MTKREEEKLVEFFEEITKVAGRLWLYEAMYGDIPTDKDSLDYSRKVRKCYEDAEPLKEALNKYIKETK